MGGKPSHASRCRRGICWVNELTKEVREGSVLSSAGCASSLFSVSLPSSALSLRPPTCEHLTLDGRKDGREGGTGAGRREERKENDKIQNLSQLPFFVARPGQLTGTPTLCQVFL